MATMFARIAFLFLTLYFGSNFFVSAQENCTGAPSYNATQNNHPIYKGDPVFIRQVENAKLYSIGQGQDAIYIVHLWGTPFEMGHAHGTIMKDKVTQFLETVWEFMKNQSTSSPNVFKPWFNQDVKDFGLKVALDLHIRETKKHTPEYFFDEVRGISNATGVGYQKILRVHMFGEICEGEGSMFGAWGDAVKTPESLLHLRALDWTTSGPFQDFPQITVYHPDVFKGYPFVNIGWSGWIGSLTGFNVMKISTSEIGVRYPDETFGRHGLKGIPFAFLLRDIIQWDKTLPEVMTRLNNVTRTGDLILGVGNGWWDKTLPEVITRLNNVTRTGDLILGVGNGWTHQFMGVQYARDQARFFNDTNMEPQAVWHPRIKDVVYYGRDWLCPSYNQVLSKQLTTHYGELAADVVIRDVISIEQTGTLQVAIYDLFNDYIYVSNARGSVDIGPLNAYDRTFIQLNGTKLFYEGNPSKLIN